MSKIDDFQFRDVPQEVIDFKDQVRELLNFGKYQMPVVSTPPNHLGRRGEMTLFVSGSTGRLYIAVSDNSTQWSKALEWTI